MHESNNSDSAMFDIVVVEDFHQYLKDVKQEMTGSLETIS